MAATTRAANAITASTDNVIALATLTLNIAQSPIEARRRNPGHFEVRNEVLEDDLLLVEFAFPLALGVEF